VPFRLIKEAQSLEGGAPERGRIEPGKPAVFFTTACVCEPFFELRDETEAKRREGDAHFISCKRLCCAFLRYVLFGFRGIFGAFWVNSVQLGHLPKAF